MPTENGGVSILSGSLCRANFQPLSQKGLGDTEERGGAFYLGLDGTLVPAKLGAKRLLKADSPVTLKGL